MKLAPMLLMLLLSTAAGAVGGMVAAMMGDVGETRVCGGVAMMAWKGHVRGDGPPVAVIDGGCTHVCFNDVHAFKPGTLRPPAKPTYMRLGDDSQVTVEGIGVVDIELTDDSGGSVRYTRKAAYYTPGMSHSLIPENKEWKLYGTRCAKRTRTCCTWLMAL